jgi:hypothetical protein
MAMTMKNAVFKYVKNRFRTSQETHYLSATDPSRLYYVRFEVFTEVTMKNTAFGDIKTQFIPHSKHITYPLQIQAG